MEPLNAESFLNLHGDNNAATASWVLKDEDCCVIDNEEDFPENPMEGNHDDQNIAHDCEQDAEKLRAVNYLLEGEDEREEGGSNSKIMEVLRIKGETVTLESDVEGENNGQEIASEVDEQKHVVNEKMNECEDCDAVDTAKTDGATEYGKEEEKSGSNIPTEQDADNSPSCLNGRNSWWCRLSCFSSPPCGFYRMLLLGILFFSAFAVHATNATKPSEYAADSRNTQNYFLCDQFSTPFINKTSKIHSKSRCYNESKKIKCQPGFEGFCLPLVTGKYVIAGCINTTGLHLDGEKCLLVTSVQGYNVYKADCHDKKCPACTNANSLEERLKMCLFLNETSGDSHSTECSPENSSIINGSVQPTHWILGLGIAVLLVQVLTSQ